MSNIKNSAESRVVLVDGCRIPFLRSGTDYADLTAYDLGRMAIKALIERTQLEKNAVDAVILGTVVANFATSNVAREAALAAGIPAQTPAFTVTMACISANLAITTGIEMIRAGQAQAVIAGGTESLSDIPIRYKKKVRKKLIAAQKIRGPLSYVKLFSGLRPRDLLPEIPAIAEFSTGRTMGQDCDRLAAKFAVSREEQDAFALRSHQKAASARADGCLQKEIAPVRVPPRFENIDRDNGVRSDSSIEKLQSLKPAFYKPYGTLTAGNSSFLTDGAAAVLLMEEQAAKSLGYQPLAAIRAYAYTAQDPGEELLLGPAFATPRVLDAAGARLQDVDVFEFHEAFAAQVLANLKCLASESFARERLQRPQKVGDIPLEKLNRWGGSLSIGHPFGATGARLVSTAARRLAAEDGTLALVASCAAGAHGNAMLLERLR